MRSVWKLKEHENPVIDLSALVFEWTNFKNRKLIWWRLDNFPLVELPETVKFRHQKNVGSHSLDRLFYSLSIFLHENI